MYIISHVDGFRNKSEYKHSMNVVYVTSPPNECVLKWVYIILICNLEEG